MMTGDNDDENDVTTSGDNDKNGVMTFDDEKRGCDDF